MNEAKIIYVIVPFQPMSDAVVGSADENGYFVTDRYIRWSYYYHE